MRRDRWIGLGLFLLGIALSFLFFNPGVVGILVDDANYVLMARFFAANRASDFYHQFNPLFTRFPPFFPLVLASFLALAPPSFPPLTGLQIVCMALMALCPVLWYRQLLRYRYSRLIAIPLVLLVLLHPNWFTYASDVMSDGLFLLLVLLSIPLIERLREKEQSRRDILLLSLFLAGAVLTRYVGFALVLAALFYLRKQRKLALSLGALVALWLLPWGIFALTQRLGGYFSLYGAAAQATSSGYSFSRLFVIMQETAGLLLRFLFPFLKNLSSFWHPWLVLGGVPLFYGFWRMRNFASCFAFFYLLLVIPYLAPFDPAQVGRFLLPISFISIAAFWEVLRLLFPEKPLFLWLVLLLHLSFVIPIYPKVVSDRQAIARDFLPYAQACDWIRANIEPAASLAVLNSPIFLVQAERSSFEVFDPYRPRFEDVTKEIKLQRLPYLVLSPLFDEAGQDLEPAIRREFFFRYSRKSRLLFSNDRVRILDVRGLWL